MNRIERADNFMASLGVECYRVGGSVRDELLGREPKDADYMVRGLDLRDLGKCLLGCVPHGSIGPIKDRKGQQLGWRVSARGLGLIEVVLPRKEENAGVGREQIITVDPNLTLREDAKRRDFTFNALYLPIGGVGPFVIDPTDAGMFDLERGYVRTTHADSFRDDPLRILRALRFVSTLGYDLASVTESQMEKHVHHVTGLTKKGVSGTVFEEFNKLLMGKEPAKALRIARDTGVLGTVFPELRAMLGFDQGSRYHDLTTDEHTFKALQTAANSDASDRVRWALLFHDSGKPETAWIGKDGRKHYYAQAPKDDLIDPFDGHVNLDHEAFGAILWREAAERLNVPKKLREDVARLVRDHMVPATTPDPVRARRERVRLGDGLYRDLLFMRMCDLNGKVEANRDHMEVIAKQEILRQRAEDANVPASTKDLAINGNDLMLDLGLEGQDIGRVLKAVLDEVVVAPSTQKLTREWQLKASGRLAT